MNVIATQNVSKKYGNFVAVDNVSLTVKKGDIYGLVGKNGAGKTTLFKLLLGLSEPSNGLISINESNSNLELLKQRSNIGFFVGSNFYEDLTGFENIEYNRRLKKIGGVEETERVLGIVGLKDVKKPVKAYSMGMKQRLGIANAILGNPEIVILDEPINGLDPQGIVDIRNLIVKLNREFGMTLIVSSHILSELELIATCFGIIDKGVLIKEFANTNDIREVKGTLVINVDDIAKARDVLSTMFSPEAMSQKDNLLYINHENIVASDVSKLLVNHDIKLEELYYDHSTLEDLYFKLTGGAQNV